MSGSRPVVRRGRGPGSPSKLRTPPRRGPRAPRLDWLKEGEVGPTLRLAPSLAKSWQRASVACSVRVDCYILNLPAWWCNFDRLGSYHPNATMFVTGKATLAVSRDLSLIYCHSLITGLNFDLKCTKNHWAVGLRPPRRACFGPYSALQTQLVSGMG